MLFRGSYHARDLSKSDFTSQMVYDNGTLFADIGHGRLVAVDVNDRRVLWVSEDSRFDVFMAPAFGQDRVFLWAANSSAGRAEVTAVDRQTGKPLWHYAFGIPVGRISPVVCGQTVIATDPMRDLTIGLDTNTGTLRWDTHNGPYKLLHPPAVSDSKLLFVASERGASVALGIAALDCSSGRILEVVRLKGAGYAARPVLLDGDKVILGDEPYHQKPRLTLFDLVSRRELWVTTLPDYDFLGSSPAISNDNWIGGVGEPWVVDLKNGVVTSR